MKAAVLHKPGAPLAVEDVDDPQPGPGEILIKVKACGVCHSDSFTKLGAWSDQPGRAQAIVSTIPMSLQLNSYNFYKGYL